MILTFIETIEIPNFYSEENIERYYYVEKNKFSDLKEKENEN